MSVQRSRERFEVVVVGGGQAGLAMGFHLAARDVNFVILDRYSRVGDAWRMRWDSLQLFTPPRLDGLPGMAFPAGAGALPTKDEVADFFETYVSRFKLPIQLRTPVDFIDVEGDQFVVSSGERQFEADQVVVATGGHPLPSRPGFAHELNPDILQLHAAEYRNPTQLRAGPTLVVGAGNSGAEIAIEAAANHQTWLAGRCTGTFPRLLYWRPFWWMITRFGTVNMAMGRKMRARAHAAGTPLVRLRPKDLAAAGVIRVPRVAGVKDGQPRLEDGQLLDVKNVVWCTGFGHDYSWIRVPACADGHIPAHDRGVARSQPGLYFVGLPFQFGVSSALIDGVGRDADYIANKTRTYATARGDSKSNHKLKEVPGGFVRAKSIVIEAPPAEVYVYVADIPRHPEWACEPMKIEGLPSSNGGAGGFRSTVHLMGVPIHGEIHVIAEEPPHRFVYECTDTAGHYRWTMTVRAVGTSTELTQSAERLEGPLWVRVIQPWLLWPLSGRRSVVRGLANIKARLEA